jgi:Ca-activated chloride channel family protein
MSPFAWGAPGFLLLLLLVPAAAAIVAAWAFWRREARAAFGGVAREPRAARIAAATAPLLLLLALAFAAIAAARPQLGEHEGRAEERGIDVAIVLDVSNSMLATDTQPSRLGRAQSEIAVLLDRMAGDRVGLVMFAREPFVRSPLTSDTAALRAIVEGVNGERGIVQPGSDLGAAIASAQRVLRDGLADTKVMLIVSDGEDRGASLAPAVAAARSAGIRIYTAGAGTTGGAPVLDIDPDTQQMRPRLDASGTPVLTRLDVVALQGIATSGNGRYVGLEDPGALSTLAPEFDALAATTFGEAEAPEPIERFQIAAAMALALLVVEMLLPLAMQPRRAVRGFMRMAPLAGAGLFVAGLCTASVAQINRSGNDEYAAGNFDAALADYKTAQAKDPSRGELYYNAGNAYDRKGEYDKAIDEAKRVPPPDDLVGRIEYAIGNHYAGAQQLIDALEAYKRSLLADPADADAKHNLEAIASRLTATPQPSPTPTPPAGPTEPGGQNGTPQPSDESGTPDDPNAEGSPSPSDKPGTQQELQRALEDALRGIDSQFTEDEAIRVLELLDETNRRAVEGLATDPEAPPDY